MAGNSRNPPAMAPGHFFSSVPQAQNQLNQQNRNWQTWSSLRLRVTNLPPNTSTRLIYDNFSQYGNLVRILIHETRQGDRSSLAEIDYEPVPPRAFWSREVPFVTPHAHYNVRAALARSQRVDHLIPSPVDKDVKYEEKQEVIGDCLDFGVLSSPELMTVMTTCPQVNDNSPRLVLNLHRKEIEIHFPFVQTSNNGSKARKFRFHIALDDELSMWRLDDNTLVLHLSKPPWYSKQLVEAISRSHSADARMWKIEDTWARQTDVVAYTPTYSELNSNPVALPKHLNTINIFRWTTFRFHMKGDAVNNKISEQLLNALRDWNVTVRDGKSFDVVLAEPGLERATWHLINGTHDSEGRATLDQQLSRVQLPFPVRYQLEVCLSHGWLSEYSITPAFLEQLMEREAQARQALVYVATNRKRIFDPMSIFTDIQYSKPVRAKRLPDNCAEIYSATVTATGVLFHTPSVEITNRIIRKYKSQVHRFLRVRFEDDSYRGQTRLYASPNNKMIMIFDRVKRALRNGIKLGDITYDFLAWGNSQLREHGAYFVAASAGMNADTIREEMGSFKETVVAKKAARMGQCFSTTRPVRLPSMQKIEEKTLIPDIIRNGYNFTDGVGKISEVAAYLVSNELKLKGKPPCLFQFRLGGCKGVLAVSKDVPGIGIQIRDSQFKFNSLSGELEIIRWAEYWQPYLNRQIIICLSQLGVPNAVFQRMQQEAIDALEQAMYDDGTASQALRSNVDPNMMTLSICELVDAGFRAVQEPFVSALLHLWRAWSLKYLKEKAKIPVRQGAFVLGCVDETANLRGHTSVCPSGDVEEIKRDPTYLDRLPEIFIQVEDMYTGQRKVIDGVCILARNPSLHEGDIRVVRARNVPALNHMCNVVVMPQTGDRDLPSMCSGGDLDGDDYLVIWDKSLIPRIWNEVPFHYTPDKPKEVSSEITTTHLIDFFHNYLRFDALGKIAHAHLGAADALDGGVKNEICHELVWLHSRAVDYPKTGVAAKLEPRLERDRWPHFMEKKGKSYRSTKVLGQLYDSVEKVKFSPDYELSFDERITNACDTSKELLESLQAIKRDYDSSLNRILSQHSIQTEFELWSTFVLDHSKKHQDYKFHEEVGNLSKSLKEQYYELLSDVAGGRDFEHLAPIAVAAYKLTQYQLELAIVEARTKPENSIEETAPMPFISFPWLLQETLVKIAILADESKPRKTTAIVENGQVIEQRTDMFVNSEGNGTVRLPDISELTLGSSKLSRHLPDPLLAELTTSEVQAGHKASDGAQVDSPIPDTGIGNKLSTETLDTDRNCAADLPQTRLSSFSDADIKDAWSVVGKEAELPSGYSSSDQAGRIHAKDDVSTYTALGANDLTPVDTNNTSGDRPLQQTATASPINNEPNDRPLVSLSSPSGGPHDFTLATTARMNNMTETCFYWKNGRCGNPEDQCKYAHHNMGAEPRAKQQITCWFWITRRQCTYSDQGCKYAHRDTGVTITPPDFPVVGQVVSTKAAAGLARNYASKRRAVLSPSKRAVCGGTDDEDAFEQSPTGFGKRKFTHAKRTIQVESDDEEEVREPPVSVQENASGERSQSHRSSARAAEYPSAPQKPRPFASTGEPIDLLGDDVPHMDGYTPLVKSTNATVNSMDGAKKTPLQPTGVSLDVSATTPPTANENHETSSVSALVQNREPKLSIQDRSNASSTPEIQANKQDDLEHVSGQDPKMVFGDPLLYGDDIEIDELSD